jgi:cytochrome d ubiquinol oxidase subunit II
MLDYETLKLVWWLLIGVLLIGFAITDGMDMGVGNLLLFIGKTDDERRVMINTVGPHWDGNQVWLVTAGGAIFAAWPAVYAAAFSGFYFAMLLALFALFFRPLGFDYRSKLDNPGWRRMWDVALFIGSAVPALVFGIAFGNLLQGVPFHLDEFLRPFYTGSFFALLNPFALLAGLLSVVMLTMHGATWLQMRTLDEVAERSRVAAQRMALLSILLFAGAGVWLALGIEGYRVVDMPPPGELTSPLHKTVEVAAGAWLDNYRAMPWTLLFPLPGFAGMLGAWLFSSGARPALAFFSSSLAILGVIMTAGISMFPFILPSSTNPSHSFIAWDATSSPLTLSVMFWAAVIFVPIIIAYTTWNYYKMWGKVSVDEIKNRFAAY